MKILGRQGQARDFGCAVADGYQRHPVTVTTPEADPRNFTQRHIENVLHAKVAEGVVGGHGPVVPARQFRTNPRPDEHTGNSDEMSTHFFGLWKEGSGHHATVVSLRWQPSSRIVRVLLLVLVLELELPKPQGTSIGGFGERDDGHVRERRHHAEPTASNQKGNAGFEIPAHRRTTW